MVTSLPGTGFAQEEREGMKLMPASPAAVVPMNCLLEKLLLFPLFFIIIGFRFWWNTGNAGSAVSNIGTQFHFRMSSMKEKEIKSIFRHERLESLDILRGFDMFWITGGHTLVATLAAATGWVFLETIENQLHHVRWEGFHFYDLIFPLFIFMMGVAIPYALLSRLESGTPKRKLYGKAFRRFVLLVLFGIVYNQAWLPDWTNPRIASVLGQIGFAYFFAAVIF
ncbi:MAG: DUF5009 domain-containing protein, partial [Bacteroidetes bacterium]